MLYVDSANLRDIKDALDRGIDGITTNPSVIAAERPHNIDDHLGQIVTLARLTQRRISLSVEVWNETPTLMLKQALAFQQKLAYPDLHIKVPVTWQTLPLIRQLAKQGCRVNATCCMSVSQAVLAMQAGASDVSLFWNRIKDGGENPAQIVADTRRIREQMQMAATLIVGSIRYGSDVTDALLAGAMVVTVPSRILSVIAEHSETTKVIQQFYDAAQLIHETVIT